MDSERTTGRFLSQIPNIITSLRVIGTACLLWLKPFSTPFYVVYTLSGLSDALDGWIARKFRLISDLGAKLDSAADLMFYTVMILRIFPVLWDTLPKGIWFCVGTVVLLRLICYGYAAVKFRRFASLHTILNKITGAMVFVLPYIIQTPIAFPFCLGIFVVSGLGTTQELLIHIRSSEYASECK